MILSVFASTAFAAGTKTEKFIEDFIASKSLSASVSGDVLAQSPIPISKVEVKARLNESGDSYSIDAIIDAKIAFLDLKIYAVDGNMFLYVPLFRMKLDIEKLIGEEIELTDLIDLAYVEAIFESDINLGGFVGSAEEDLPGHGKVTAETFKLPPQQILASYVENGEVVLPEGVDPMELSDEAAILYLSSAEGMNPESVNNILKSNIKLYFDGDSIVDIAITEYNALGDSYTVRLADDGFTDIKTNVSDDDFKEPFLYFDYTFMFSWVGMILVML